MRTVNNTQHFRSAKVAQPGQTAMSLNNDVVECDGKPAGELTELALYDMPPMRAVWVCGCCHQSAKLTPLRRTSGNGHELCISMP